MRWISCVGIRCSSCLLGMCCRTRWARRASTRSVRKTEALFSETLNVRFVCPEPVLDNDGVSCEDSEDTAADDIVMCVCAN